MPSETDVKTSIALSSVILTSFRTESEGKVFRRLRNTVYNTAGRKVGKDREVYKHITRVEGR